MRYVSLFTSFNMDIGVVYGGRVGQVGRVYREVSSGEFWGYCWQAEAFFVVEFEDINIVRCGSFFNEYVLFCVTIDLH